MALTGPGMPAGKLPIAPDTAFKTPERVAFATFLSPGHFGTAGLFVRKGKEFNRD